MTEKNFKNSFLLILAALLVDTGELLREIFSYSAKKPPKPQPENESPEPPPATNVPPAATTQTPPPAADPTTNNGVLVDSKGVPFDPITCGKAKEPFYASGPRAGQWKKRKGVTDESYDAWYAKCLPVQTAAATQTAPPPVNNIAAGQFGATDPSAEQAPTTLGEFMAWIAVQQTAGKVTPELVNQAYVETGISFAQVNDPKTAASAIATLWNFTKSRIQ